MNRNELHITSSSPEETFRLGAFLGKHVTSGSVIALTGELGSGKTCLAQGIARGLGVPEDLYVTSPTYTIVNDYPGRLHLFHVDLYRIENIAELTEIGLDEIMERDDVTVIEWAEKMIEILPEERLFISIAVLDDHRRNILMIGYGQRADNLIERCLVEFGS